MQNIQLIKYRTSSELQNILKERLFDLKFNHKFCNKANIELALLQNNEFMKILFFIEKLDLPQTEIEDFLLSPKNPEIAKINGLLEKSDRLNKIVQWENRLKEKINTKSIKNTWDYAIPALAGIAAMAGTYTFSTEENSALGVGFLTTLSVGF